MSTFAERKNEVFKIQKDALDTIGLQLVEVTGFQFGSHSKTDKSFSLLFRGPDDSPLQQGTYMVEHRDVGKFPLFIVPVYSGKGSLDYEAIFNNIEV